MRRPTAPCGRWRRSNDAFTMATGNPSTRSRESNGRPARTGAWNVGKNPGVAAIYRVLGRPDADARCVPSMATVLAVAARPGRAVAMAADEACGIAANDSSSRSANAARAAALSYRPSGGVTFDVYTPPGANENSYVWRLTALRMKRP